MARWRVPDLTADQRYEITRRMALSDGLLIGLDFDGTLAPIDADPDEPTITPACRCVLEAFVASPATTIAVISGRELSDLRTRVGLDGVVYAGNHGLELSWRGHSVVHSAAKRRQPAVRRSIERLSERLTGIPGWQIEDKGLTATIHVRETPPERLEEVRSAVEMTVQEAGCGLQVSSGKQVFEIRPDIDWDKGAAITYLSARTPDRWLTMYVGDDVTDEDGFRAVRPDGIGVLVGSRTDTNANYRLPTQAAVAPFLDWLTGVFAQS